MTTPPPPPGWDPPQGYGPPPASAYGEETIWAVLAHLSIFAFALLGPLVIYLVKRDESPFTRQHAAEALNFHITLAIAGVISVILLFVLIGFFFLLVLAIAGPILGILAAIAASKRQPYRYPFTLRFVS